MKSRYGIGSKFQSSFSLQFSQSPHESLTEQTSPMLLQNNLPVRFYNKCKILIVDDDPFNVFSLKQLLCLFKLPDFDQRIVTAFNGVEAIEAIESNLNQTGQQVTSSIGLVITDCNMPVMDGFEASKSIINLLDQRGVDRDRQAVIVALTGHVEPEYKHKAKANGIQRVYSKPITKEILQNLLVELRFEVQ